MRHSNLADETGGDFLLPTGPSLFLMAAIAVGVSWYIHFVPYPGYFNPLDFFAFLGEVLFLAFGPFVILVMGRFIQRHRGWVTDAPVLGAFMVLTLLSYFALSDSLALEMADDEVTAEAPAEPIPEMFRAEFLQTVESNCFDGALKEPMFKKMKVKQVVISSYCRCGALRTFETLSVDELEHFVSGRLPRHLKKRMNDILYQCMDEAMSRYGR